MLCRQLLNNHIALKTILSSLIDRQLLEYNNYYLGLDISIMNRVITIKLLQISYYLVDYIVLNTTPIIHYCLNYY